MEKIGAIYCQSCGMPMNTEGMFGTGIDGNRSSEYCTYCFKNGAFTLEVSLDEFISIQVNLAAEKIGVNREKALEMAHTVLPTLSRWKN